MEEELLFAVNASMTFLLMYTKDMFSNTKKLKINDVFSFLVFSEGLRVGCWLLVILMVRTVVVALCSFQLMGAPLVGWN